ncbi:MAG: hypothetical protein HOP17_16325 [Acidobacteria bacterium]|nr:hypothetical protein [Acidobacteriota bacterium]
MRQIHELEIHGMEVDAETRCSHWNSPLDIIAIKFKCCGKWFPCFECHAALQDHRPEVWKTDEFAANAVLCGGCGNRLTIDDYLAGDSSCPKCKRQFNPGCKNHRHLYFE